MPYRWYVAQTHPLAEEAAGRRLKRQGFVTYGPLLTLRRPERRGSATVTHLPLFPGYRFVSLDIEDDPDEKWKAVNSTRAIITLLPHSDTPLPIIDRDIDDLRMLERAGNFIWPRSSAMQPGAKLRIDAGIRASSLANTVIECLEADDRKGLVRGLWDCMGRRAVVTVPIDNVSVIAPAPGRTRVKTA